MIVHYFEDGLTNDTKEQEVETYRTYFPCDIAFEYYPELEESPSEKAMDTYVDLVFEKFGHTEEGQWVMNEKELARYVRSVTGYSKSASTLLSLNFMFMIDRNENDRVDKNELSQFLHNFVN